MRPVWPRLALRLLVRAGPAWPCFGCGGLITSGQERQTFNSLPFASISTHSLSSVQAGGTLIPSSLLKGEGACSPLRGRRREPLLHADGRAIPCMERPSGVRRSGKLLILFRFVPFRSISDRPNPQPRPLPEGKGISPAFARTTSARRTNDAYNQCRGWVGDGAMGSCR